MQNKILNILLFLFSIHGVYAVEIKTTIDRNPVNINESFQITYTATQSPDDDPDFTPLEKSFEILNQRHSSNASWVNGQSSKTIEWILNVMAKQTGKLLIPVISFGDDFSQAASIVVTQTTKSNTNNTDELFLEVEATPETPYVQSQILYTMRLFRRVQLAQASLNEPTMADALIEKLGEDKNYNTELNGFAYAVTERKYAIFPQKSGISTIEPLVLTAQIVSKQRPRFNGFFSNQMTKTKRITSEAITIDVKAAPDSFKDKNWLPAEQVYVEEKWSGDVKAMKVGEPLTRTLTILANGSTVAQLPELHIAPTDNQLKTYPDQAVLKEKKDPQGHIAFREQKVAYIPSHAGSYTLPAIEIPWFNTQTQTMEIARIPEKTVTAIGSAPALVQSPPTQALTPVPVLANTPEPVIKMVENKFWMWVSMVLAFGWLATILFVFKNKQQKPLEQAVDHKTVKLKETIKSLKKACAENDALAAKNALLAWGKIKFNSTNLSAIALHTEARLRDEIHFLNQHLYAETSQQWQGKKLFQFFTENNAREKVAKKSDDKLEPLYKV